MRHGEANRRGIEDLGLTELGRTQAEALARALDAKGELASVQRLLASPAPRAQETATALSMRVSPALETSASLSEMGQLPPLGSNTDETLTSFLERVSVVLSDLTEENDGETVVAVCHAGVIVASVLCLFDIPRPGTGSRLEPDYCSVTEWEHRDCQWTLRRFNSIRAEF